MGVLFALSAALMLWIGWELERLNEQRIEALQIPAYLQNAKALLELHAQGRNEEFGALLKKLGYLERPIMDEPMSILHYQNLDVGEIAILKDSKGWLILSLKYLDESHWLVDALQVQLQDEGTKAKLLVILDGVVLLASFLLLLVLLSPLHPIIQTMRAFGNGDLKSRITPQSRDELGELAGTFNAMADSLVRMMEARAQLLRRVSHEFRTPIAKMHYLLENPPSKESSTLIKRLLEEIESLTNQLLFYEQLQTFTPLVRKRITIETLLAESLNLLHLEDHERLEVVCEHPFELECDLTLMSTAIKNLIDNAVRYATHGSVVIHADKHCISVWNYTPPLPHPLEFYFTPFASKANNPKGGAGLGLGIVAQIAALHGWRMEMEHDGERCGMVLAWE